MRKHAGLLVFFIFLAFALVSTAWAQSEVTGSASSKKKIEKSEEEKEKSEVEIEKTVVTATRTETPVEDLPVSVTVITAQEIEEMPVKTVDEVLMKAAGVQIRRNKGLSNTGSHTTIYMRGTADSSRVLVLKDGVPLNMAYTGTVGIWNNIDLENIEKIEIVRGASSALYGSSAMGGVINIITKRPGKGVHGEANFEGGMLDTYIGNAKVSTGTDRYTLRASGVYKTTNGYEYYKGSEWKDYYKTPENKLTTVSVGGDVWLGESLLRLDYDYYLEDSLSATTTQYDGDDTHNDFMLSWGMPLGNVDLSVKSYYFDAKSTSDARKYDSATGNFNEYYYNSSIPKDEYGALIQASFDLGFNQLTVGSDIKWAKCKSNYTYADGDRDFRGKQDFYSFFVNDELSFFDDKLIVNAGVRYDYWKNHDGNYYDTTTDPTRKIKYPDKNEHALSPRAGVAYKLFEGTTLRASFGTGFKAPSLYDLYRSGPHGATRFDLANPDLDAEKLVWSYDVGFDTRPTNDLFISMTFYQSRFKDFLGDKTLSEGEIPSWFTPDPGQTVIQVVNLGKVDIYGVEASLEYRFTPTWWAFVNHTFNVSKIKEYPDEPEVVGNYLAYTPRHMTKVGVVYDNPKLFTLGVFLTCVGERYSDLQNSEDKKLDGYQVVDVKISRKLIEGLEIYGYVNNLTDEDYKEYYTTYNPPLTAMAGLKYTF